MTDVATTPDKTTTDTATSNTATSSTSVKSGWRTTEGILTFLSASLSALTAQGYVGAGTEAARIAGAAGVVLSVAIYTWCRTSLKAAA